MQDNPPSLILYPKKLSAVLLLLGSSIFVAGGIWMGITGDWIGYLCAAFFALGILVATVKLIPGSTYLQLDQSGFTFCNMFKKTTTPWSVIDSFFVITIHHNKMVVFNFVPSYDRSKLGRRISKGLANCEGGLPDTYGKKAEELADLMNTYLPHAKTNEDKQAT